MAVVVPVLNAAKLWAAFHEGLLRQGLDPQQILIIDSSSTDGTAELARGAGYRVVTIERSEFNHGGTRQTAVELLEFAEILVFLTQDAILANDHAISNLLRPFDDPLVGAAYGRQLPRTGAGPIESHARCFNYPAESQIRTLALREKLGFKSIFCSNSFAAYRKSALATVGGFPNVIVSEETIVSARLLLNGWKTAYAADAVVYHSHHYSYKEEFRRYFDIGVLHAREPWLLEEFGKVDGEGMRFVRSQLNYLFPKYAYLVFDSILRFFIKYAGYRAGRLENKLDTSLARHLSQQGHYWR